MTHHPRTTPEGRELGRHLARWTQPTIERLRREGEPDTRCQSCAFTPGTVPNGCPQTQMDALKCVMEGVPFYCHVPRPEQTTASGRVLCHGWYAARVALHGRTCLMPWAFSTDEPKAAGEEEP